MLYKIILLYLRLMYKCVTNASDNNGVRYKQTVIKGFPDMFKVCFIYRSLFVYMSYKYTKR